MCSKFREGSITISNDELKFRKTITIKQNNTFYFGTTDISILIGKEQKLSLINHTNIENIEWSSSDPSVVTVNNNGTVKGIGKGTATITAKTILASSIPCLTQNPFYYTSFQSLFSAVILPSVKSELTNRSRRTDPVKKRIRSSLCPHGCPAEPSAAAAMKIEER